MTSEADHGKITTFARRCGTELRRYAKVETKSGAEKETRWFYAKTL